MNANIVKEDTSNKWHTLYTDFQNLVEYAEGHGCRVENNDVHKWAEVKTIYSSQGAGVAVFYKGRLSLKNIHGFDAMVEELNTITKITLLKKKIKVYVGKNKLEFELNKRILIKRGGHEGASLALNLMAGDILIDVLPDDSGIRIAPMEKEEV